MKLHRVGSITLGCILIGFGSLFLCHIFFPALRYEFVFRLWPLILIFLGAETLFCSKKYEQFRYDFGAVCMMILLGFLTVCMAYADLLFQWASAHPGFYL